MSNSPLFQILKDEEDELRNQIPSFLSETAKSSPSKLFSDYEKTGEPTLKKAAGQALDFLRSAASKAKEWTAPAATGAVMFGAMATPKGRKEIMEHAAPAVFKGFDDVSSTVIEKLRGRSSVSKRFIQDTLKQAGVTKQDVDLIEDTLKTEGDKIDVPTFAEKVKASILPLERKTQPIARYESINLKGDRAPDDVLNYKEHIYESPIETSAGRVHFPGLIHSKTPSDPKGTEHYFAHTRTQDLMPEYKVGNTTFKDQSSASIFGKAVAQPTVRQVLEVQSDLMQKGRLENDIKTELNGMTLEQRKGYIQALRGTTIDPGPATRSVARAEELMKLEPYRNTWWKRIVRSEVQQASKDNIDKVQFPVGQTAMEIEGLGSESRWQLVEESLARESEVLATKNNIKVGLEVIPADGQDSWIITDVLGDGKFKAMPKDKYERTRNSFSVPDSIFTETFDISGSIDKNNPIYKFYEDDIGKFLKSKFNAQRVKDGKGVEWWEVDAKAFKNQPVLAHGKAQVGTILAGAGAAGAAASMFDKD